ncbi:hypothetical protein INT43_002969 [Umbelopsis isabellina]|uniref:non-specific serine/threonine protein kinase n=1 Tax=Mortierella isabellina TaxID=91625 RepID=A0A8H7PCJ0_MORIS|nr:hypothetical protein INT43_002969 [Umbelopsis isabellina]
MSAANPPLPFELGSVITDSRNQLKLELWEALGSGSYAIVYKAQAQHDNQFYALKCISKVELSDEDLELQRQEVDIHRSFVKTPRIVRLYSHFETEEYLFLLLEYIQGTDLYWWILHKGDHYDSSNGRKLDTLERLELLCNIFEQCLDAVDSVHNKNIAHRDLKPENFLITVDKTIKLIDFGLATTEQYPIDFDCGSKPYMSFECHNPENPNYDAFQADIWSLGIIFINLFWHRSPWSRPDDTCPAYTCFTQNPTDFLMERFEGMTRPIATFLADRVFCSEKKGRVTTGEWMAWCKNLVTMFSDDGSRPSTPKKTIGFLPLSISLSTLTSRSGSKSKESVLSARIRRSSFFSLLPPSPVTSSKRIPKEEDERNYVPMPENYALSKSMDQHSKSWSQEFDFDGGEMDFSEPISFADGSTIMTPEESKKEQDDNDSGFGSDETEGTRQSFDSGQDNASAETNEEVIKPVTNKVPKYVPPAKRSDHVPPMDIRAPSAQHWRRPPPSSPLSALPSSVGGRGYHVGAHNRRPFAPPQPSWRIKHQRSENWPKSNALYHHNKHQNDKITRHSSSPSFIYQRKNDKIPLPGDKKGPHVPVYTPPNRMSSTFTSASVSIFNNRMPGMTTYRDLHVGPKETAPVLDEEKPADDLEMSEMDVVFGEDQLVSQPVNVERRNHLTKGAISDFGKLLRSIARDRSQ